MTDEKRPLTVEEIRALPAAERDPFDDIGAVADPEQLKRWLTATGRDWIVLNSVELVDALKGSWPDGVRDFQGIMAQVRDHRRLTLPPALHPVTGGGAVYVARDERLDDAEILDVIRWLTGRLTKATSRQHLLMAIVKCD